MKITEDWLEEWDACGPGREWFRECSETEHEPVIRKLMSEDKLTWANWGVVRVMTLDQRIRYAVYAAETVIKFFKSKYPDDDRPRKAIDAAREYLKNKTLRKAHAAHAAADAAYAAADAAYATADSAAAHAAESAAAHAAESAAADAAYATAHAAHAAAYATAYAAHAAADAAHATALKSIIEYGLALIGRGEV